ncbi:palmitoyltransferase akr1 [Steccherinum ochraceum]|uniref:Palmitoyltransferase n=1 Tax=Steccherinum ochraceum TaxID=92696 RepID=A0A4R0R1D9_9APHY|nr:palmitoyltransferase akr1 [Steccherinum ochraceum]
MDDPSSSLVSPKAEPSASQINVEQVAASNITFAQGLQTVQEPDGNIFIAAQRGDVATLQSLIESGKAKATDRDEQNITPLHWAAINAQVAACRYLLEQGAEVDALGGDLVATPMQWAARNGYLYVIHLLIAHNADPNISDAQGYNTLHLVTHSSSVMPLLYLLHQPINVDSKDSQGHTSLMWAAYQGDALSVDLLLKHGANPNLKDDTGLSPLHWAVVRGNRVCIRRLIESGADIAGKDNEGRTARDMAVELKSLGAWKRALEEGGLTEDGVKKKKPLSERNTKIAIFIVPTIFLWLMFMTLTILPWYTGVILAMALFFAMHHIVTRVLLDKSNYTDSVTQSPYFAGIIAASMVWVLYAWITRLTRQAHSHPFSHLIFALNFGLCAYNFFRAIFLDAGTCPKPQNDAELKAIVEDLASEGRLNVGVNNHRQFLLFVTTLVIGIALFDYLSFAYFSDVPISPDHVSPSCVLTESLCSITSYDTFLISVAFWSTLQLSWTIVLLATQFWQVARQMTTLEVSNLGRYGFMGGRGGASMVGQMGHQHRHSASDENGASEPGTPLAHSHHHHRGGMCGGCGSGFLMNLLGFDRFTKGKAADGLARAAKAPNPFDLGIVGNCKDFWTTGRELGVEYEALYDVPVEGFTEAKRRRAGEESESGGEGGRKPLRKSLLMGFSLGRGGSSRAGYEPLSQV